MPGKGGKFWSVDVIEPIKKRAFRFLLPLEGYSSQLHGGDPGSRGWSLASSDIRVKIVLQDTFNSPPGSRKRIPEVFEVLRCHDMGHNRNVFDYHQHSQPGRTSSFSLISPSLNSKDCNRGHTCRSSHVAFVDSAFPVNSSLGSHDHL